MYNGLVAKRRQQKMLMTAIISFRQLEKNWLKLCQLTKTRLKEAWPLVYLQKLTRVKSEKHLQILAKKLYWS